MNPSFTSILVSVTEGCHVGCAHCGFIGSKRDRETDVDDLGDWVSQACTYGIPAIIFTGGEPFERFDVLQHGVRAAAEHGKAISIFTSSYWASSFEEAVSRLAMLEGITQLYLSTDFYHQKRVPYEFVYNVIAAADKLNIAEITLCVAYANEEDRLAVRKHYEQYESRVRFYESRVIPTPYIQKKLKNQDPLLELDPENYKTTCWIETPIINPNGDVFACHAGKAGAHGNMEDLPYWLGNLKRETFADIMERARWKLEYQYLRTHGPKGIVDLFKSYPNLTDAVGRSNFTGPCDLCFSVLSTKEGQRCLTEMVSRPEVLRKINMHLVFRYGEPALELAI